tara:strand:+ start:284 stop:400 length:117 start_codon:yes stop_codon:yes gene_type:complete
MQVAVEVLYMTALLPMAEMGVLAVAETQTQMPMLAEMV